VKFNLAPALAGARILGLGSYQPEHVVTNADLAKRVETDDQWIRDRVGIVERRIAQDDTSLVDMAVEAGARAVKDSGLDAGDIDTVIVATCTMPNPIPNAAAQTADRIGIHAGAAFDLNAACAGFCYGLGAAADLVRSGTSKNALVIGAEKLSDWVDWDDRSTCIIFADAAGAAVVGGAATEDEVGIGPVAWGSAGDIASTIRILGETTNKLHQEGQGGLPLGHHADRPGGARGRREGRSDARGHRRADPAPGEPAHRRSRRQAAAGQGRPGRHAGRGRHRVLGQHVLGLDPDGARPHARRRKDPVR